MGWILPSPLALTRRLQAAEVKPHPWCSAIRKSAYSVTEVASPCPVFVAIRPKTNDGIDHKLRLGVGQDLMRERCEYLNILCKVFFFHPIAQKKDQKKGLV